MAGGSCRVGAWQMGRGRAWRGAVCACVPIRWLVIVLLSASLLYIPARDDSDGDMTYADDVMEASASRGKSVSSISCIVDGNASVDCIREGEEIYVPFTFLSKDFEAYGRFAQRSDRETVFEMEHSKGEIYSPLEPYHAMGIHIDDLYSFVEGRPWVIFLDGRTGVPLCRQWFPEGFFFSTNIAQFGLAHYSQHVVEPEPERHVIDNAGSSQSQWSTPPGADFHVTRKTAQVYGRVSSVLSFHTTDPDKMSGVSLAFDKPTRATIREGRMYHFILHYKFTAGSSIVFHVHRKTDDTVYQIHYVCNDTSQEAFDNKIIIGIGASDQWRRLTRNIHLDLEQGYNKKTKVTMARVEKVPNSMKKLVKIELRGQGEILNLTLASTAHLDFVQNAADWVMQNQDEKGGWAMPVKRPLGTDVLQPGWYSALGQGVCISLLARAYGMTKDERYLAAAIKALQLFHVPSSEGGVKAVFLDQYVWYEEYPTQPPSFVLNGFIIALLGLYDLATTAPPPSNADAKQLFDDGMASLKVLLPLYDIGSRTVYDLRHMTMRTPPNVCRWDYHNLHAYLMQTLATIDKDPIFKTFGDRWLNYKVSLQTPKFTDDF